MNLAVTPVKFNNYSATQNCKNNNSQQNFEGMTAKLLTHVKENPEAMLNTSTVKHRDMIIDRTMHALEEVAKKIGLNTDKLEQRGMTLDFHPEECYSTRMTAFLKDKDGKCVTNEAGCPIFAKVKRGTELDQGENLAYDIKGLNLDAQA